MRKLVPYLAAAAVFAVAVVGPGFAGAQAPSTETCVPMPSCQPLNDDGSLPQTSSTAAPVLCCWKIHYTGKGKAHGAQVGDCCDIDDLTAALDEPLAQIGDALDYTAFGWGSCVINNGAIAAFTIYDSFGIDPAKANTAHAAAAPTPPDLCLARLDVTGHHGTTFYKPYGKHPQTYGGVGDNAVSGNYGHKYDHEWHLVHCGGYNDNNCPAGNLWLTNKTNTRSYATVYCSSGRGYCPNVKYQNVQKGRPHCSVANLYQKGVRDECYYVY
jgi:hypothetical protein